MSSLRMSEEVKAEFLNIKEDNTPEEFDKFFEGEDSKEFFEGVASGMLIAYYWYNQLEKDPFTNPYSLITLAIKRCLEKSL